MADADKEKAAKVAAARKKYEQLKKQKEKGKKSDKKDDKAEGDKDVGKEEIKRHVENSAASEEKEAKEDEEKPLEELTSAAGEEKEDAEEPAPLKSDPSAQDADPTKPPTRARQPSLSVQSKLRSDSFRRTSNSGAISPSVVNGAKLSGAGLPSGSPEGEVTEIYRKQASRLDELERENKKLGRDLETSDVRGRKMEDEIEELRESNMEVAALRKRVGKAEERSAEADKLRTELASVQRQNAHLQTLNAKPRQPSGSSPTPTADLQAELESKSATIESMSLELSTLQSQLAKSTSDTSSSHTTQVAALEEKLARAERAAGAAQRELVDLRVKVKRLSERAVRDGSESTSAAVRLTTIERENAEATRRADEAIKKAENLEAKLAALTNLQREGDARRKEEAKGKDGAAKEATETRRRVAALEGENGRLREAVRRRKERSKGEVDDEGLDELEDEERKRLEARVRELEADNFELRRGVWRDKRTALQPGINDGGLGEDPSSGGGFDDVDLSGGHGGTQSTASRARRSSQARAKSSFANVLTSGFAAFTGQEQEEGLLEDDDEDMFDEDAFRKAHEAEAMRRIERVKEVKRGLKDWVGWRMDLVESRMSGGGAGEIFDV